MAQLYRRLNVLLDKNAEARLWELHTKTKKSRSNLIREAINHLYETKYQ